MRYLPLFFLLLPALVGATNGLGHPLPAAPAAAIDLQALLDSARAFPSDALLSGEADAAERAAIAAAFAAPLPVSERGDDLRRVAALTDSARAEVAKMRGVLDRISNPARQIANLSEAALSSLPLGLRGQIGNTGFKLAIAEARFTATQAEVDLYLSLDFPNTHQDPIFIARGIPWSRQGGFTGTIELELVADWGIDLNQGATRLILKQTTGGRDGTFVSVDCEGFVAGRIEATVLLSRDWVLPLDDRGGPDSTALADGSQRFDPGDRVHADFTIDLAAEEGFLTEVNLERTFVFTKKPDIEITLGAIAIDLSDGANPSSLQFPENYHSPHVVGGSAQPTWQGFFLRGLEVRLPPLFRKADSTKLAIGAPYLIIDRSGFTGHLYADDVLPLGEKTADGWPISVDSFDLRITQNAFESARFIGLVNVPLLAGADDDCDRTTSQSGPAGEVRPEDCLGYTAHIGRGELAFSVRSADRYCVELWKADLTIEPNSRVDLRYSDGQFEASATLNGTININGEVAPNVGLTVAGLSFDSLVVSSRDPHFSPGLWDFPDEITAELMSFDLSFTHIDLTVDSLAGTDDTRNIALNFNTRLNMEGDMRLDCFGMFKMTGKLDETGGRQRWRFNKLKVRAFSVDASTSSWGLKAAIAFYEDDPVWGTGFYGAGRLSIAALGSTEVAAVAQFGSIGGGGSGAEEKYFFVDVMARFNTGVTLPGGIKLMGIGGGVYKNMTRATAIGQSFASPSNENVVEARNAVNRSAATQSPFDGLLGQSTSGIRYEVDLGNRFGAFLQVIIAGQNEEAFSINARLELEVRDDGGWRAALEGNVTVMGPVNFDNDPKQTKGVGIFIKMAYINSEEYKGFRATADVFVNIKEGTVVGGVADEGGTVSSFGTPPSDTARLKRLEYVGLAMGYAGNISLEFSNERWYIHIGYPNFPGQRQDKRIKLVTRILGANVGAASYFCVGQDVPPIPPLPRYVSALTGKMDMTRDFASYESAAGFAFGTELALTAGGEFLIFYYELVAGVGFDINIRNYGEAICAGDDPNGSGIGVNGWYAAGQAYAYVDGDVGVQAPWWMGRFRVPILDAAVAAVLQVKAPNPVWGRGVVAGQYNALNGLIKGRFRIEAEFGDNCVITGRSGEDPFASVDLIPSITPDSAATEVNTDATVAGYVVMPINEKTELGDREYRLNIETFVLREVSSNTEVPGQLSAQTGLTIFEYVPTEYLKGDTEYEISVTAVLEARDLGARRWESPVLKRETRVSTFRTAPSGTDLDPDNVKYSYPLAGQVNFYPDEHPDGFLGLKRKQPGLTDNVTAVYHYRGGQRYTTPATWEDDKLRYLWQHPVIPRDKVYQFSLVQNYTDPGPTVGTTKPDDGSSPIETTPVGSGNGPVGTGELPDGGPSPFWRLDDEVPLPPEAEDTGNELIRFYFRTSTFGTFADKLAASFPDTQLSHDSDGRIISYENSEVFGTAEINGGAFGTRPLIDMTVDSSRVTLNPQLLAKVFDHLPWNAPSTMPDYTAWNHFDPAIPWRAVTFLNPHRSVTQGDFRRNRLTDAQNGGTLQIILTRAIMDIAMMVAGKARTTLELIADEYLRAYASGDPDERAWLNRAPFFDCFPTLADAAAGVTMPMPEDGILEQASTLVSRQLNRDSIPRRCDLPAALLDMYEPSYYIPLTSGQGHIYPVQFTYRLPDGRLKDPITINFNH